MSILDIFKGADINEGVKEFRADKSAVLLDVRSKEEYASGHITGSINIPLDRIDEAARRIPDKKAEVFVYCLRLGISLKQFDALVAAGIETVFDLTVASGADDWYKLIKGIGPKTAHDLLDKLDWLFINGLEHAGGYDGSFIDRI